ncbi:MAG: hypothetical protein WCA46_20210 [Actinocatenispora sp.]
MSVHMNPSEVTGAGRRLARMAHDARAKITALFRTSTTAARANEGWRVSASLAHCRDAWEKQLERLVDDTEKAGQGLVTAAGRVAETDQEAAHRINHVLDDLDGR